MRRIIAVLAAVGASLAVWSAPAYADGDSYGCNSRHYCVWGVSPHYGVNPNFELNVDDMKDCAWYYNTAQTNDRSQMNRTGYWLEALNRFDGSRAIIYGYSGPTAMTGKWYDGELDVRRIPAGKTHC